MAPHPLNRFHWDPDFGKRREHREARRLWQAFPTPAYPTSPGGSTNTLRTKVPGFWGYNKCFHPMSKLPDEICRLLPLYA